MVWRDSKEAEKRVADSIQPKYVLIEIRCQVEGTGPDDRIRPDSISENIVTNVQNLGDAAMGNEPVSILFPGLPMMYSLKMKPV